MGKTHDPQPQPGEVGIESIELDLGSRDDIPALPVGLRHPCSDRDFRERLFALMDGRMLPGVDRTVGRPGMEMCRILVMGVVKQGLGRHFDRLHELANQHRTLRRFPGHADIRDGRRCRCRTLVDSVSLLNPKLLAGVSRLIVEGGHAAAGKKPGAPLRGRCGSFAAGTGVRCPTDVSLLRDAVRCLVRAATENGVPGRRQCRHLLKSVRKLFNTVRSTRRASPERVEEYPARCSELALRVEASLPALAAKGVTAWTIGEIEGFLSHAVRRTGQAGRRLLRGGTIPHEEKVFPVFEPHTRWIPKGKAGCPVEPGVPVRILEDRHGFVLHHEVMREGGGVGHAVPMAGPRSQPFPTSARRAPAAACTVPRTGSASTGCPAAARCRRRAVSTRPNASAGAAGTSPGCAGSILRWNLRSTASGAAAPAGSWRRAPRGLRPCRRPLRGRPERPPHRPASAPQGAPEDAAAARRLTADTQTRKCQTPPGAGTAVRAPMSPGSANSSPQVAVLRPDSAVRPGSRRRSRRLTRRRGGNRCRESRNGGVFGRTLIPIFWVRIQAAHSFSTFPSTGGGRAALRTPADARHLTGFRLSTGTSERTDFRTDCCLAAAGNSAPDQPI